MLLLLSIVIFSALAGVALLLELFIFIYLFYSLSHVSHATAVVSFLTEFSLAGCVSE